MSEIKILFDEFKENFYFPTLFVNIIYLFYSKAFAVT